MSGAVLRAGDTWPGRVPPRRGTAWSTGASVCAHLGAGLLALVAMTPPRLPPATGDVASFEVAFLPAIAEATTDVAEPMPSEAEAPALPALAPLIPLPEQPPLQRAEALPQPPATIPPPPAEATPQLPPLQLAEALPQPPLAAPSAPRPQEPVSDPPPLLEPPPPPIPRPIERAARREPARRAPAAETRQAARRAGPEPSPIQGAAAPAADPGPPLITAPRFRRPPRPPEYPARAIELDITGTVVVRALLDPTGDPQEARIHRSSGHSMLDGAALAAVRRWAFEPAARDGRRIEAWVEVPVHFRLN